MGMTKKPKETIGLTDILNQAFLSQFAWFRKYRSGQFGFLLFPVPPASETRGAPPEPCRNSNQRLPVFKAESVFS